MQKSVLNQYICLVFHVRQIYLRSTNALDIKTCFFQTRHPFADFSCIAIWEKKREAVIVFFSFHSSHWGQSESEGSLQGTVFHSTLCQSCIWERVFARSLTEPERACFEMCRVKDLRSVFGHGDTGAPQHPSKRWRAPATPPSHFWGETIYGPNGAFDVWAVLYCSKEMWLPSVFTLSLQPPLW